MYIIMKVFSFLVNDTEMFQCNLISERCLCINKNGLRCKNQTVIGLGCCRVHLSSQYHLKIKPSNIPNGGLGLFAFGKGDAIIFKKDQNIIEYAGEKLTEAQVNERYGEQHTAPYCAKIKNDTYVDCACERRVGSLANSSVGHNNARLSANTRNSTLSVKATKNIKNGQEILLSYGTAYKMNDGSKHKTCCKK